MIIIKIGRKKLLCLKIWCLDLKKSKIPEGLFWRDFRPLSLSHLRCPRLLEELLRLLEVLPERSEPEVRVEHDADEDEDDPGQPVDPAGAAVRTGSTGQAQGREFQNVPEYSANVLVEMTGTNPSSYTAMKKRKLDCIGVYIHVLWGVKLSNPVLPH